ncbi:MAG: hypothetical protein KAT66_10075 [Candidatus Lokiarchaeota archaeon]|nr:hypothetical protein [Candidatus Lokiarchaeota archaeon]
MNGLKTTEEEISQEELFEDILIICPECQTQKKLKIPSKIIIQSKNVTTVSIPTGMICEHHFQAFIDKSFKVRGYQVVDFEFPKIEYYESRVLEGEQEEEDDLSNLTSLSLFQEIIKLLRGCVDDREILGSAIFTVEGKVLYSSIPHNTLFNTIREFEVRNEKKLHSIIKMFLELKNHQKVCSEYIEIHGIEFILVLIFAESVNFGIGNMLLKNIAKKLKILA